MDKRSYWQSLTDEQRDALAARLGRKRTYLDRIFLYGRTPGAKLTLEIYAATGGEVSPHALRDDLPAAAFRR